MKFTLRTDFSKVKSVFGFRVRLQNPKSGFPNRTQPCTMSISNREVWAPKIAHSHYNIRSKKIILFFPDSRNWHHLFCFHIRVVLLKSKTTFHQYSAIKFKNPFFWFEPGGTRSRQTPFFSDIRSQGGYFIPLKLENVLEEGLVNKGGDN